MRGLLGHRYAADSALPLAPDALIACALFAGQPQARHLAIRAMVTQMTGVILQFLANGSAK